MVTKPKTINPVVLLILDGFGVAPPSRGNAISSASTPFINKLLSTYPSMTLQASGEVVGLPWGEMGNSEVGHLSLGSGKIIYQSLPRITRSIADGSFFKNEAFLKAAAHVKKNQSKLHLLGLVSPGGVHSFQEHLNALLEFAKNQDLKEVWVHAFLDGRDAPRDSGLEYFKKLQNRIEGLGVGKIATISGRYYAMDRDNRWERTKKAYLAIAEGEADKKFLDPIAAIQKSYQEGIYDEEFEPTVLTDSDGRPLVRVEDNDAIIFFNFRADRARQLTKTFVLPGFEKFKCPRKIKNLFFATMTEYEKDLPAEVAFPVDIVTLPLAKILAEKGFKQLHLAETEKYPHITYFFNGGTEKSFLGEERILIPSPQVSSYDQKPEMSSYEIKERLISEIKKRKYHFMVVNFANPDMVAHTGNFEAAVKAIEVVDSCLSEIVETVLGENGVMIITADHGNAEEMLKMQSGEIDKEHSTHPVPCILVGKKWEGKVLSQGAAPGQDLAHIIPAGILADVAPTILDILGLEKPKEMEGRSLI